MRLRAVKRSQSFPEGAEQPYCVTLKPRLYFPGLIIVVIVHLRVGTIRYCLQLVLSKIEVHGTMALEGILGQKGAKLSAPL